MSLKKPFLVFEYIISSTLGGVVFQTWAHVCTHVLIQELLSPQIKSFGACKHRCRHFAIFTGNLSHIFTTSLPKSVWTHIIKHQVARADSHQRNRETKEDECAPNCQQGSMTTPITDNHDTQAAKRRHNKKIANNHCNRCSFYLLHLKLGIFPKIIRYKCNACDDHYKPQEYHQHIQKHINLFPTIQEIIPDTLCVFYIVLIPTKECKATGKALHFWLILFSYN